MSDMQNFIERPTQTLTFKARVRASGRTAWAFIKDQKWVSLLFLIAYCAAMYWDFLHAVPVSGGQGPEWVQNLPDILDPIREELAPASEGTWRAILGALIAVLYWGNALLFIADRSEAFGDATVVGLVRYLSRGAAIILLLAAPIAIGFALLFVPGLLMVSTAITAATLAVFRDKTVFRAISTAFRLNTRGQRVAGFSRNFISIVGAYALTLVTSVAFTLVLGLITKGLLRFWPEQLIALHYSRSLLGDVFSSGLNLVFSIFVLRLYAEQETASSGVAT